MVSNVGRKAKAHVSPHEPQLEKDEPFNKINVNFLPLKNGIMWLIINDHGIMNLIIYLKMFILGTIICGTHHKESKIKGLNLKRWGKLK